ncbi:nucleotidyltransferase family protein [Aurantiacibacter poecillastricola]|uniref:nucleotidyltransferase family protein n=1 Tax=Aurantiacibacter poecillastricola TaxID=3064385 RepID=UPI00273DD97D|nr:nucleotidyltransferase family protein [Aurantiacibacter sp. 219JJ12-13]MDP5260719.1 nucleotidyltransferase family protein [Aurantiacibacter sp. 219JJ12-13]
MESIDAALVRLLAGDASTLPSDLAEAYSVNCIAERIEYHGIAYFLYQQDILVPKALHKLIRQTVHLQGLWEISHREALAPLFGLLRARGVESIVTKGTALAYSIYDDPAMRRRGDTDLLVRRRQLQPARQALREGGWQRLTSKIGQTYQEVWRRDTGMGFTHDIDLHWNVVDSPLLQQVLDVEAMITRRQPLPALHEHAHAVDPVLGMLQGFINQTWHFNFGYEFMGRSIAGVRRLIWDMDNHLQARAFTPNQWAELQDIASLQGMAPVCRTCLYSARDRLGTPLPAHITRWLDTATQETPVSRYLSCKETQDAFWMDLAAIENPWRKAAFAMRRLFPSPDQLRERYGVTEGRAMPDLYLKRLGSLGRRLLASGR